MLHPGNLISSLSPASPREGGLEIFQYNPRKDNGRFQFWIFSEIISLTTWISFMLKREIFLIFISDECLMTQ